MIADKFREYLASDQRRFNEAVSETLGKEIVKRFRKQFMEAPSPHSTVSLSKSGKCAAHISFDRHGYPKPSLNPEVLFKFFLGDVWEATIVALTKHMGFQLTHTGSEQQR